MWAGCRLHTTATSICSSVTGYHPSAWARLLCTRHVYVKTLPCHLLLHHNCTCTQSKPPITLYLLGAHGPLACRGNSYRTYSPVLSMSCQLPSKWAGKRVDVRGETPAWFPALRSCKSTRESLTTQHPQSPFLSHPLQRYAASLLVGPERMKPGMWMLCKLEVLWDTEHCYHYDTNCEVHKSPWAAELFALPASMPGPPAHWIPVVFRQQVAFCLVPRNDHDWFKGVLKPLSLLLLVWDKHVSWSHTYDTRSEALRGMVASLSDGIFLTDLRREL